MIGLFLDVLLCIGLKQGYCLGVCLMSSSLSLPSLREVVHNRLLDIINNVQSEHGKIIIVDEHTIKILDFSLTMHEILDAGVYLVEIIRKGRQPYPLMDAIYFLSSDSDNIINLIGEDFKPPEKTLKSGRKGAKYLTAHLFFTREIKQMNFEELAKGYVAPYARALIETFIDFIPMEERVFIAPSPSPLNEASFFLSLISSTSSSSLNGLSIIAQRIMTIMITMGWKVDIRFQSTSIMAGKLAAMVQEAFNIYSSRNREFNPQKHATLLILDRTIDLIAPILHEFTYQAMAMDLLEIEGNRYEYKFTTALGAENKRSVSLDENDILWKALRHTHIADCSKEIISSFNQFMKENKAAAKQQKNISEGEGVTNLGEIRETMNALSEFHEMKNEFSLHLGLAQECFNQYERRRLAEVALFEQDMVMGKTVDGELTEKNSWNRLASILDISGLLETDRTRVIILYLLTQPKLSPADQNRLFEHAKLSPASRQAIKQYILMTQENYTPRKSKLATDSNAYDVSRYTPAIKDIALNMNLQEFPSLSSTSSSQPTAESSLAKKGISLRFGSKVNPASSSSSNIMIMYIIGGITHSEMRVAYELSEKMQTFIGGDEILTPNKWLDILSGKKM